MDIDIEFTKKWFAAKTHEKQTWRGVPIVKCPMDLMIYQELITKTKPQVIIECGVKHGGTTLFLAEMAPKAEIIGVELVTSRADAKVLKHPRITIVHGSSINPAVVDKVRRRVRGRSALVILDSDHKAPHVLTEMQAYGGLVPHNGYMIVEDTIIRHTRPDYGPGPADAVDEFMSHGGDRRWEVDEDCHKLMMSYNPGGYLRRK